MEYGCWLGNIEGSLRQIWIGAWWEVTDGLSVSQTMGFMDKEGNGEGEEEVGLRSSNQARPEGGLGIVLEALNFEKKSSPKIRSGAF